MATYLVCLILLSSSPDVQYFATEFNAKYEKHLFANVKPIVIERHYYVVGVGPTLHKALEQARAVIPYHHNDKLEKTIYLKNDDVIVILRVTYEEFWS